MEEAGEKVRETGLHLDRIKFEMPSEQPSEHFKQAIKCTHLVLKRKSGLERDINSVISTENRPRGKWIRGWQTKPLKPQAAGYLFLK